MASPALAQHVDEYELKAAVLLSLTKFVEGPADSRQDFGICIFGDDPFGSVIDDVTKGKMAYGRTLQVQRLREAEQARQCRIVFFRGDGKKAAKLIEAVRGMPVLTVGETADFIRRGGLVYLSTEAERINMVINSDAAASCALKVSAKLLSLAKIFKDSKPGL
jgi:hypothetical protein